jgi:hypothetical protein
MLEEEDVTYLYLVLLFFFQHVRALLYRSDGATQSRAGQIHLEGRRWIDPGYIRWTDSGAVRHFNRLGGVSESDVTSVMG